MESVPRDLKDNPQLGSIDKWHARGAVIIGRVSELNDEQRASFLRYCEGLASENWANAIRVGDAATNHQQRIHGQLVA
jgi:hypothetical protein